MKAETDILEELNKVFRNVFQNELIVVTKSTSSCDINEWDSLRHAMLIAAIEKHFKIRFKLTEILNFKTVGNICEAIKETQN